MFRLLCEDIIYVRLSVLHVKSVFILEDISEFCLAANRICHVTSANCL